MFPYYSMMRFWIGANRKKQVTIALRISQIGHTNEKNWEKLDVER